MKLDEIKGLWCEILLNFAQFCYPVSSSSCSGSCLAHNIILGWKIAGGDEHTSLEGAMTFSIMTQKMTSLIATLTINDTQHNNPRHYH
jgi:hypothetical protein